MYIQKAEIKNIKSIEKFEIKFPNPAGWHVLIGDNGSGKSTIVRAMALALVGSRESYALRTNWNDWLNNNKNENFIKLFISRNKKFDKFVPNITDKYLINPKVTKRNLTSQLSDKDELLFDGGIYPQKINEILIGQPHLGAISETSSFFTSLMAKVSSNRKKTGDIYRYVEKTLGFFSAGFGPYRRFEGGDDEWQKIFENPSFSNLASHLSIFGEDVALTKTIDWLIGLYNTSNDQKLPQRQIESKKTLKNITELINFEDIDGTFLPNNTKLVDINSEKILFKDGNGATISVNQMSDGYRSILSLTFELIRQLVRVYGSDLVFKNIEKGEMFIDLPGVVLIDEIDAHLHPTWQTRIGQWFLKYFPQLQFIVTTHSPLVCRACEKGSIWKLAAPGSNEESGEVTGIDRERLIYGNVLDAYGTGVFGENTSISQDSNDMLNRLSELNVKSMMGLINKKESAELQELRTKLPTENAIIK